MVRRGCQEEKREDIELKRIGTTLDGGVAGWGSHLFGLNGHAQRVINRVYNFTCKHLPNQKPWTGGEHGSVQSTCVVRTFKNQKRSVFKNTYCCMQVTQTSHKWLRKMLLKSVTSQTQGILFSGSQVVWKNKISILFDKKCWL